MNDNIITKTRFLPLWKEEKELNWLAGMSKDGWHLVKKGFITYHFQKGDSKEYIYQYDYKAPSDKDFDEYKQLYHDSGWEYIDGYSGWHYFKTTPNNKTSSLYTDLESKQRHLKKLLAMMVMIGGSNAAIISTNIVVFSTIVSDFKSIPLVLLIMWGVSILVVIMLAYTSIRIGLQLRKLRKSVTE